MSSLECGQRVHFVLASGLHEGECRAAIIVRVIDSATEKASLFVLTDGLEDSPAFFTSEVKVKAHRESNGQHGRWHYRHECPMRRQAAAAI